MNSRHAAALALVGWYLMLPPLHPEGPTTDPHTLMKAEINAPLSEWHKIGDEFKTEKECRDYPVHFRHLLASEKQGQESKDAIAAYDYWFQYAQCISTDDARLKSK